MAEEMKEYVEKKDSINQKSLENENCQRLRCFERF